ncbi:MAG: amino acid adenylation domain-containing protein, partial [Muribaculaceae bacterium]|nr:amino acid adenylation domain-containing protein [Muribaculaceae bacterium]
MKLFLEKWTETVKKYGSKTAVTDMDGKRSVTFAELDGLSGIICAALKSRGVKKGDIVPVCMARKTEYTAVQLGILKCGAAFAALSPDYPKERIEYILRDCGADFAVDEAFVKTAESCTVSEPVSVTGDDLAFAVYTSGSTGNPKGILHCHSSLSSAVERHRRVFSISESDVQLSCAPFSFVAVLMDVFTPLSVGAEVHILPEEKRRDIRKIERYIEEHNITVTFISPQMLRSFQSGAASLRLVITGSERVSRIAPKNYRVINTYGCSETACIVSSFEIDREYENTPIGKPAPDIKLLLLDGNGCEVKAGEEGEICVVGHIAREYINLPEQTAAAFISQEDGTVLFHTNDMGKMLPDGNVLYLNRRGWMVKINGQRVETGEIEVQTGLIPFVKTAAVKGFENKYGQTYLCAYFQLKEGESTENPEEIIKEELRKKFPEYMIPKFIIRLSEFPLNQNGKLDRLALKAPDLTEFRQEYKAPETACRRDVCAAFEQVLGIDRVGVNDDFFSLGGDSIQAVMLLEKLQKYSLTAAKIFELRTPGKIADACETSPVSEDFYGNILKEKSDFYPLTDSQTGVFLECLKYPESTMYNIPFCLRLPSDIDLPRFKVAAEKMISLRPVLSVSVGISKTDGVYGMIPRSGRACDIPVINAEEPDIERLQREFIKPFDLENGALYRMAFYCTVKNIYFLCDIHHIVSDGTSVADFLDGIWKIYSGRVPESEDITQFDLSLCEKKIKDTAAYQKALEYFSNRLDGVETDCLPIFDFPENTEAAHPSKRVYLDLSGVIGAEEAERFARKTGVTENTLFMGAFAYALAKYGCRSEVLFCTVNNGRHDARLKHTMGMLVRTLPIYVRIDEERTTAEYLRELQKDFFETMSCDCCSFEELANKYGISSDILFVYQAETLNGIKTENGLIPMTPLETGASLAKISVHAFKKNGGYEIFMDYQSDVYSEYTADGLLSLMGRVLRGFFDCERLKDIPLVSDSGIELLNTFHGENVRYDRSLTVPDLFRRTAEEYPEHTAVIYKEKRLSYRELNALSDKVCAYVNACGIGRGQVVSILINRSENMPVTALGVMKSGAVYQPLDPTYPPERIEFMMKDADSRFLVADAELLNIASDYSGKILLTKDIPNLPNPAREIPAPSPEDIFILLYTSGTTGTPKGCMVSHGNLAAFCNFYRRYFKVDTGSVITAYASFGFDANMMETYPVLTGGGTLCIIPEELRLELPRLNDYFIREKVTHAFMTTQVGRQFAEETENSTLKFLLTGGEALVPVKQRSDFTFVNCYGPTECTVLTTVYPLDKNTDYDNVPIGKPLDNTEIYVVDKQMRRLPAGAVGELCAAGYQVTCGYLNRPEQTEKAYTANIFTNREGYGRIYHTGDDVRFLPDGNIRFVGRRDGQVKIRGFRIELSEIEVVIRKFPDIRDVTVTAYDAAAGGKAIAAYIVSGRKINTDELKAFIMSEKPPYMIPSAIMQIDEIPLNQNMKVNKRALPKPLPERESRDDNSRPMSELEKELSRTVSRVIGHSEFSVTDNLIHAGLTSLSAIKLAVEIEKDFGAELEVRSLMSECSVLSLENEIYRAMRNGMTNSGAAEETAAVYGEQTLTREQLGVYYDTVKNPGETVYNIPAMFRFPKSVGAERLAAAVKSVLKAHPYVNTRFVYRDGKLRQLCEQFSENKPPEISLISVTEEELKQYRAAFVKPFDLTADCLYRITVAETEKNVCLLADFHHVIFDGGSLDLFIEQTAKACEGTAPEKEKYSCINYVIDSQNVLNSEHYKAGRAFFGKMLEDFENVSRIAPDLPGKEENGKKAECVSVCDKAAVEAFCGDFGVTPAHLFLAASLYTAARYTGSGSAYISTISSGRQNLKLRNSFGMFVKTLPIGCKISDKTAAEFVKETREILNGAVSSEDYPFAKIYEDYGFTPEIMYACQLGVAGVHTVFGETVETESLESDKPKFKISVHIEERDGSPAVCVQYNDALYSAALMEQFAESIAVCVNRIIETPESPVRKISLVTEEQEKLLKRYSKTAETYSTGETFHGVFERTVRENSKKTALIAAGGKWSYGELNRLMNRAANGLPELGFGKGDTAAVLLPRTEKLIIAMYAVMKAGGAYIPCDPDYPEERIRTIAEDSGARLVITEKDRLNLYENAVDIDELLSCGNERNPDVNVDENSLAYMIYTSGSTGKPKGVMLRHKGIVNYLRAHETNTHIHACVTDGHTMVSVTTASFDMSLKETAAALCNGLTLVLADEDCANDPPRLAGLMEKTGGDIFNATPSRMLMYMESEEFCRALAKCRVVMSGGEAYSTQLLEKLKKVTSARLFNTYGPTEITVSCNACELTHRNIVTVGKPLLNCTEYIVDSDGNLLPPNAAGELYVGGFGVAEGYCGLPEMTAERFAEFRGERVYKTGDYAKWTADGQVMILGRTDSQVKLRGLRIELEEVEQAILSCTPVSRAVAVIAKIGGTEHLCAYYTASEPVDGQTVRNALKSRLAKYMIPDAYMQLDEIPMTPNGKTDRKALPEPQLGVSGEYSAPRNETERTFCRIFADVLNLERVGREDSFFDLGGTSLTVTSVVIAAAKVGFEITYGDVFSHPAPRELARLFAEKIPEFTLGAEDLSAYDYGNIERVLAENTFEEFQSGRRQPLGNILLTGATGFLGIHILREFLETESGRVYCLMRRGRHSGVEERLKSLLFYYFENTYEKLFGTRIFAVEGDVTDGGIFDMLAQKEKIDTVINCAANVKHFSAGTDIEDVNIGGVTNAVCYCQKTGSRLIHISTTSVSGFSVGDVPSADTVMTENMLYFGQVLDTKYGRSKFCAERAVLEEIHNGLNAKIMRVGNLSARDTDGEFQMNFSTNSFVGRLRAYGLIGKFPYSMMNAAAEMAPIDSTAKAILALSGTPEKCCLFHPYNNHSVLIGDIILKMRECGINITL